MAFTGILRLVVTIGTALVASAPPSQPASSIRQVATLTTGRAAHTASTLASGHVLVAGGMTDGGGIVGTVELFDPRGNTVQGVAPLSEKRAGHTATVLRDGRVLIAGGLNGEYLATVEIFEPSTKRFRAAGSLIEGRSGHTATLMPDGRVLMVGGVGRGWTFLRSAELFDPATGQSSTVGQMSVEREGHSSTLLSDGRVLVVGGHRNRRPDVEVHASAEIFSAATGRFESAGSLTLARHKHDAVRLTDGRVLVLGGADRSDRVHYASTEVFDARTGTFQQGPAMSQRRYKIAGTSVVLPDGNVLVAAGATVAELLDVSRWTFQDVPGRFPAAYRFATAVLLDDGDVMVAGGYTDENRNSAGIWRFHRP